MSTVRAELAAYFEVLRHALDFDRDGLGEAIVDVGAADILESMDAGRSPDGQDWPELSTRYEAWKSRHGYGNVIGVLHGVMKQLVEIRGHPQITATEIVWAFGDSPEAAEEGEWFHNGNPARNQPARPFFGISPAGEDRIARRVNVHVAGLLR